MSLLGSEDALTIQFLEEAPQPRRYPYQDHDSARPDTDTLQHRREPWGKSAPETRVNERQRRHTDEEWQEG